MTDDNRFLPQAIHDLGSALWFGGAVMGVAGVNKSGSDLADGMDRIAVASSAWRRFSPVEWAGIAATFGGGLALTASSGPRLAAQKGYATVGGVKIAFVVAGAAASAYANIAGRKIAAAAQAAHDRGEPVAVKDATIPSSTTPADVAAWQKKQRIAQFAVPFFAGGNVVCNAWLTQAYRLESTAKGVLGRLNPL